MAPALLQAPLPADQSSPGPQRSGRSPSVRAQAEVVVPRTPGEGFMPRGGMCMGTGQGLSVSKKQNDLNCFLFL